MIDVMKKNQNKDKVKSLYLEIGDLYYNHGAMFRALESYRGSWMYSVSSDDLITIGIKIGLTSIFTKDF